MIFLCCNASKGFSLSDIGNLSNSIMAILTFALAFYVFIYQRGRERRLRAESQEKERINDLKVEEEKKANIKMQWFKDLIIEPKIEVLTKFYDNLNLLQSKINSSDLNDDKKIELIGFVKKEHSNLRKEFLDILQHIDDQLFSIISKSLDELTDKLTEVISDDELKLTNEKTYNREVKKHIQASHDFVLSNIFKYDGKTP